MNACVIIESGVSGGVKLSNVLLRSKTRGFKEGFKEPRQHNKAPGGRGLPSRGQGGGEEGQAGVASLIGIHFQPGPWNSFVPLTGLHFPPALILPALRPVQVTATSVPEPSRLLIKATRTYFVGLILLEVPNPF